VFGAGGDRDHGKRPLMGAIAAEKADRVIVTDDNPRSEEPARIRAAILAAAPGAIEIGDRRDAIRRAIAELADGDVLLIAGKGHETGQIIGKQTFPFSDHEAVATALEETAAWAPWGRSTRWSPPCGPNASACCRRRSTGSRSTAARSRRIRPFLPSRATPTTATPSCAERSRTAPGSRSWRATS